MSNEPKKDIIRPINLLSLDGGGIRGVSQLVILDEIMKRVRGCEKLKEMPKPSDYFHLIGGTGTGGIIAILLGRLKLTTEDALTEYLKLLQQIFGAPNRKRRPSEKSSYKASTLEKTMKQLVARNGIGFSGEELMGEADEIEYGRTFVCALPLHNMRYIQRLRTYSMVRNNTPNCKIWQAARATMASPWLFKPIDIPGLANIKQPLVGGGVRCNNPTVEVVHEAYDLFGPENTVQLLLSIGSGHPQVKQFLEPSHFEQKFSKELLQLLKQITTDCELIADQLSHRYINIPETYVRLNVSHGAGMLQLEEWKEVPKVVTHTRAYLQDSEVSAQVDNIVKYLCRREMKRSYISLGALSGKLPLETLSSTMRPVSNHSTHFIGERSALSALFIGQNKYIKRLKEYFTLSANGKCLPQLFLLHGMGGIGKTQIALRFLVEVSQTNMYSYIFWIDGSSDETIMNSFKSIAEEAMPKKEKENSDKDIMKNVLLSLSCLSYPWLAVFDNADGPLPTLEKYIPKGNYGHILTTSRLQAMGHLTSFSSSQEVIVMSNEDAISLLLKAANIQDPTDDDCKEATELVDRLGHLPLAIDIAGSYIQMTSCSIHQYLKLYQESRAGLLRNESDEDFYGHTVYGAWDLTFDKIQSQAKEGKVAAKTAICILETVAFLHHQSISMEIFERAAEGFLEKNLDKEIYPTLPQAIQHLLQDTGYLYLKKTDDGKSYDGLSFKPSITPSITV
ncbi:hypothetical protein M422DRAFT_243560 [Sphaerobolus stellatus SS14]|nr:hypothetical protein M422DRAFT_243560 [Sphaerobolus stellatus SS14]